MQWQDRCIDPDQSILKALKKMDALGGKLLLVLRDQIYIGVLSIGDIQRAILQGMNLEQPLSTAMRDSNLYAEPSTSIEDVKKMVLKYRMEFCPVVDGQHHIVEVFFWEDFFPSLDRSIYTSLKLPLVIMAGGMGTRLNPLTKVFPKPLLPVGEHTILEEIAARFLKYDCHEIHLALNYKADLIKNFLKNVPLPVDWHFYQESSSLGTAGALALMKHAIHTPFFVSNCDILIQEDLSQIYEFHRQQRNIMTIVSALKHIPIAYGTLQTGKDGTLRSINEKPELTFQINTGVYLLEPELLGWIPDNSFYPMTKLIDEIIQKGYPVGVYPVSEKSWIDIGEMDLYKKYISGI